MVAAVGLNEMLSADLDGWQRLSWFSEAQNFVGDSDGLFLAGFFLSRNLLGITIKRLF
jgi:hypothetical protein